MEPGVESPPHPSPPPPALGHSPIPFTYLCSSFPNRFGEESGRCSRPPTRTLPSPQGGVFYVRKATLPPSVALRQSGLFWEESGCSELLPHAAHTLAARRRRIPPHPQRGRAFCADRTVLSASRRVARAPVCVTGEGSFNLIPFLGKMYLISK
uniref:Uncharacterized protein n=1 Tax=Myotis myotis TaxID=51298 RepID=A0A7J7XJ07_MYOMY|nr:hypothetical protein mMyoMyo1_011820 [Myotis myotis]